MLTVGTHVPPRPVVLSESIRDAPRGGPGFVLSPGALRTNDDKGRYGERRSFDVDTHRMREERPLGWNNSQIVAGNSRDTVTQCHARTLFRIGVCNNNVMCRFRKRLNVSSFTPLRGNSNGHGTNAMRSSLNNICSI